MYVLQSGTTGDFYPADRCVFQTIADSTGGYVIGSSADDGVTNNPMFYPGNAAESAIPGSGDTDTRAILGYIGKSGRFVAITNP